MPVAALKIVHSLPSSWAWAGDDADEHVHCMVHGTNYMYIFVHLLLYIVHFLFVGGRAGEKEGAKTHPFSRPNTNANNIVQLKYSTPFTILQGLKQKEGRHFKICCCIYVLYAAFIGDLGTSCCLYRRPGRTPGSGRQRKNKMLPATKASSTVMVGTMPYMVLSFRTMNIFRKSPAHGTSVLRWLSTGRTVGNVGSPANDWLVRAEFAHIGG